MMVLLMHFGYFGLGKKAALASLPAVAKGVEGGGWVRGAGGGGGAGGRAGGWGGGARRRGEATERYTIWSKERMLEMGRLGSSSPTSDRIVGTRASGLSRV